MREAWEQDRQCTYSECVSAALVIEHAKCMRSVILSSVAYPAVPQFPTLSHERHDFWEEVTEHKLCVLIFSKNVTWNVSHCKKKSERYEKYLLFLSYFNEISTFSTDFIKPVI